MTLNRYERLRKHKKHLKQRHARDYGRWNVFEDERKERESFEEDPTWRWNRNRRNGGYEYWSHCYLSGCRRYAKSCTNRRIRAKYRRMLANKSMEEYLVDVVAPQGSDYEKEYDYLWTIW